MNSTVQVDTLKISPTSELDIPTVLEIFEQVIGPQKNPQYTVWERIDTDSILNDIHSHRQYKVCIDNEILAVFAILQSDELIWQNRELNSSLYLHRIVAQPKMKGQKLFKYILDWCIALAKSTKKNSIRMDTWADNEKLLRYYHTFGFKSVSVVTTSHSCKLPEQNRGIEVALLELPIDSKL